jgi:hypothetical protein
MDRLPGRRALAGLAAAWLILQAAAAWPFTCNGRIVSEGMSSFEVLGICGPPDYQETVRVEDYGFKIVKVDRWYYNCGFDRLTYILTFREGEAEDIRTDGYGTGPSRCD